MHNQSDYGYSIPGIELRNAAVATQRIRFCIAYIRKHKLTGERLEKWRGMIRDWQRERRWYRRAEGRSA